MSRLSEVLTAKVRQNLERARVDTATATERLIQRGTEGDMFMAVLGKDGKVHVKPYIRGEWN